MFSCFFFLAAVFSLTAGTPKYVFYFIGDGMGQPQVEMARRYYGKLNMDQLPVRGSLRTSNVFFGITDSAAAGTALACGVKTINGRLGLDAEGKPVRSVAVDAKQAGKKVAILTTVGINNATPAAFYAHVMKRSESRKILEQYPAAGFDILAGYGVDGMKHDAKLTDFVTGASYRKDNTTAAATGSAESLEKYGIRVIHKNENEFFNMKTLKNPVVVYFNFKYEITRGKSKVRPLSAYVKKSIELLKDHPQGFFMMAEGGAIDKACHINDGAAMLLELREFDRAIGKALEFYRKHPDDTLIIVTADHHTGGLSFYGNKIPADYTANAEGTIYQAYGIKNTDSFADIMTRLKKKNISVGKTDLARLKYIYAHTNEKNRAATMNEAIRCMIDFRSGIYWTTGSHTNEEVNVFAIGRQAEQFSGTRENSELGKMMKALYK